MYRTIVIVAATVLLAGAQTKMDLSSQGRNADFTSFISTRPVRAGSTLPATCTVAEMFFKVNAPAGANFYACTSVNVWTLWLANPLPSPTDHPGKVLSNDGTAVSWSSPGGDVTGSIGTLSVTGLQNRRVSNAAPAGGQVLTWNHLTSKWEPTFISPVPIAAADQGKLLSNNGVATVWSPLGGDVSGPVGAVSVKALQNRSIASTLPTDKQVLMWNQASSRWEPSYPDLGVTSGTGLLKDSTSGTTVISVDPSLVPSWYAQAGAPQGSCVTGRDFATDTGSGALYNCNSGVWHAVDAPLPGASQMVDLRPGSCASDGAKMLNPLWSMPASTAAPAGVDLTCNAGTVATSHKLGLSFVWPAVAARRAFASIMLPERWNGQTDFHMDVYTETGTGTIAYKIEKACVGDADPDGSVQPAFRDLQIVTLTNPAARTITRMSLTPLFLNETQSSANACNTGKTLLIRVTRDVGDADSFSNTVYSSHAYAVTRGR